MRYQQGDPSGDPGTGITTKHKVDENRLQGGSGDGGGAFVTGSQAPEVEPLQLSQPAALCRALYDFNPKDTNLEDSKCCLSFLKV